MKEIKKAPSEACVPDGAFPKAAKAEIAEHSTVPSAKAISNYSTKKERKPENFNLFEIIPYGEENAIPAKDLANVAGYRDTRSLRFGIEYLRKSGCVILSSDRGYFLPSEDKEQARCEIIAYIRRCDARAASNRKSVRSAKVILKEFDAAQSGQLDVWGDEY